MTGPDHLIIAPILIPFVAGAIMLLYGESRRRTKLVMSLVSAAALLVVTIVLVVRASDGSKNETDVQLLGTWTVPKVIFMICYGLSASMLVMDTVTEFPQP